MEVYMGTVCAFGFNFAPLDWAYCNGATLAISQYSALYAVIGTQFGGNGTTTFQLPNLNGKVVVHQGTQPGTQHNYVVGETAGVNSVTLNSNNLPAHTHNMNVNINANNAAGNVGLPADAFPALNPASVYSSTTTPGDYLNGVSGSITLGQTGSNIPMSLTNPSLTMNYCIALYGLFPVRN